MQKERQSGRSAPAVRCNKHGQQSANIAAGRDLSCIPRIRRTCARVTNPVLGFFWFLWLNRHRTRSAPWRQKESFWAEESGASSFGGRAKRRDHFRRIRSSVLCYTKLRDSGQENENRSNSYTPTKIARLDWCHYPKLISSESSTRPGAKPRTSSPLIASPP